MHKVNQMPMSGESFFLLLNYLNIALEKMKTMITFAYRKIVLNVRLNYCILYYWVKLPFLYSSDILIRSKEEQLSDEYL